MNTPNIDAFATTKVLFQNAYCYVSVSGALRASLLTGVFPDFPKRFSTYNSLVQDDCPCATPLSKWFTQKGY
ncbi:MAG: hypothetical protein ACOH2V_01450 [Candidatus Saccharimonadaceae bacterium]